MKILHVISDRNIGGAGVLLCHLLRHLDRRRFESVVALPYGSLLRERILELEVPIVELQSECSRPNVASVRELCGAIRGSGADVVHTNAAVSARIAGRLCGRRVIYTRHCCFAVELPQDRLARLALRRGNRWLCDTAIATAEAAAENLRAMGIPKQRIRVILNGCEPIRAVGEDELAVWREKLRISEEDLCIGICARLEPCKGHGTFLRAAKRLSGRLPHKRLKFLIIGDGSLRPELERQAREAGLSEQVIFVGFVKDPAPLYRLLTVHVNCSRGTETSCLAISEGMSAGLPTVASDYGGNPAMLGKSGAGYCFPAGDAGALATALARILEDDGLRESMSRAARQRYAEKFTAEGMTRRLEQVYAEGK